MVDTIYAQWIGPSSQKQGDGRMSAAADRVRGWYLKCPRESPSNTVLRFLFCHFVFCFLFTVYTDLQESKIIDRVLAKENSLDRKEQSSKAKKAAKQSKWQSMRKWGREYRTEEGQGNIFVQYKVEILFGLVWNYCFRLICLVHTSFVNRKALNRDSVLR